MSYISLQSLGCLRAYEGHCWCCCCCCFWAQRGSKEPAARPFFFPFFSVFLLCLYFVVATRNVHRDTHRMRGPSLYLLTASPLFLPSQKSSCLIPPHVSQRESYRNIPPSLVFALLLFIPPPPPPSLGMTDTLPACSLSRLSSCSLSFCLVLRFPHALSVYL